MSFNSNQFREIIRRSLELFNPAMTSDAAVELLSLTCAVESDMGTYLHQVGGPARGCMMIEPPTYHDVVTRLIIPVFPKFPIQQVDSLDTDIEASIVVARFKYWPFSQPLPNADDVSGLAKYWKRYYNTELGRGTVEKAIEKYQRYCL